MSHSRTPPSASLARSLTEYPRKRVVRSVAASHTQLRWDNMPSLPRRALNYLEGKTIVDNASNPASAYSMQKMQIESDSSNFKPFKNKGWKPRKAPKAK